MSDPTPTSGLPPGAPPPTAIEEAARARTAAEAAAAAYFIASASTAVSAPSHDPPPDPEDVNAAMWLAAGILLRAVTLQLSQQGLVPEAVTDEATEALARSLQEDASTLDQAVVDGDIDPLTAARLVATRGWSQAMQTVAAQPAISDSAPPLPLKKLWVSKQDDRVRPLHRRLEGQTRPLNDAFWRWPSTGQVLDYPGDRRAPLEQTVNCRCMLFILPL